MRLLYKTTFTLILFFSLHASATIHSVQVTNFEFIPATLNIEAGDSVVFTNILGFHNVEADDGSFRCADDCESSPGDGGGDASANAWSTVITFNSIGSFQYFCEIHGSSGGNGMAGVINVISPVSSIIHEIHSSDFLFTPSDIIIEKGDIINFINDVGLHNVRSDNNVFQCSQGCLNTGNNFDASANNSNWNVFVRFDSNGEFRYFSEPDGGVGGVGMSGIIRVQSSVITIPINIIIPLLLLLFITGIVCLIYQRQKI